MNKQEFIARIAEKTNLTKKDSKEALDAVLEIVEEELVKGEKVQLVGFGTFEVRTRKERKGRNPKNPSMEMIIPASKSPVFKAGKNLKDKVNK